MKLTAEQKKIIENAMRVAADVYQADDTLMKQTQGGERFAIAFRRQRADTLGLLEDLENHTDIELT